MVFLTKETATVGQHVRIRCGRRWYPATITSIGEAFGGTPSAALDINGTRRCELLCKLRPAAEAVR